MKWRIRVSVCGMRVYEYRYRCTAADDALSVSRYHHVASRVFYGWIEFVSSCEHVAAARWRCARELEVPACG